MKKLVIITALICSVFQVSGQNDYVRCVPSADTGNLWIFSAILQPVRNPITGHNVWQPINDADHIPINCSTVVTEVGGVTVYFSETCYKIGSVVVTPDESTVYSTQAKIQPTDPLYGEGGYKCGVRVFKNRAVMYLSKPGKQSLLFNRDSLNNSWNKYVLQPSNIPQTDVNKITITQGYNYIDIKTDTVLTIQTRPNIIVRSDPNFPQYILDVRIRQYSTSWIRVMITDPKNNAAIVPVANYPEGMQLYADFGNIDIPVNALLEKFSPSANFWMMGVFKGIDD